MADHEIQVGQEVQAAEDIYLTHFIDNVNEIPVNSQLLNLFIAQHFPNGMGEDEIRRALQHIFRGLVALKRISPNDEPLIGPQSIAVSQDGNQWKYQLRRGPSVPVSAAQKEDRPTGIWGVGMLFLQMALGINYSHDNLPPSKFKKVRKNLIAILSFKIAQNKGYGKLHENLDVYQSKRYTKICTNPGKLARKAARRAYLLANGLNVKETLSFSTSHLENVLGLLRTEAHGNLGTDEERIRGLLSSRYFEA